MKHLLTVFLFLAFSFNAYTQISVQNISGFPSLASNNHLLNTLQGTGIQLTNINYTGDNNSIGYFYSADSIIGISNGLVLTTGNTANLSLNNNSTGTTSFNSTGGSDADLSSIANAPTFDASILEMDFVSSGDTIEFQMFFASEEYPEYVCIFNDAFAFLVSGDGYNGVYSNGAENIALVPNTNDPISINTVNGGIAAGTATPCITTNTNYYIDNPPVLTGGNSNYPLYFDGFTTVITVKFGVTPDSTYHLKMAIADALDAYLDSGIFLKAHSLSSNGPAMVNT